VKTPLNFNETRKKERYYVHKFLGTPRQEDVKPFCIAEVPSNDNALGLAAQSSSMIQPTIFKSQTVDTLEIH
jgi:hypothetical protein